MKKIIIVLIITNIILAYQIASDRYLKAEEKLNREICIQEMMPTEQFDWIEE